MATLQIILEEKKKLTLSRLPGTTNLDGSAFVPFATFRAFLAFTDRTFEAICCYLPLLFVGGSFWSWLALPKRFKCGMPPARRKLPPPRAPMTVAGRVKATMIL